MWKTLIPKTIRGKIMILTAAVTLLITVLTTTVCFSVFQLFLRRNQVQSAEFSLQVVSNNIATDMKDIIYFSKWCCSNGVIQDYLEAFKDVNKLPTASNDSSNLRPMALSTHNRLKEEYYKTRSYKYIRAIVSTNNENNFLHMTSSVSTSSPYAAKLIRKSDFFEPLYHADDFLWIGLIHDPLSSITQGEFIPIVRPVYDKFNSEIIGWTYVEISTRLFTDYLATYPLPDDSLFFINMGDKTYRYQSNTLVETQKPYEISENSARKESFLAGTLVHSVTMSGGEKRILIERPIDGVNDWSISQILSEQQFKQQKNLYTLLIIGICFFIVSMGILLAFFLNRFIMEPIHKLSNKIDGISTGDFSRDNTIEWNHELGQIGRGINNMSGNIITLMEKRVSDEKQKKDLEYQILQSQINPHFLYNTLNSIKWMATIQNAGGIADMTTALARLLKNVSKGTASMIPLREELDLIKDYFLIQQYRYGGSVTIEYQIQSDELYNCQIHRFSLQPIIENALFHGIEPKGAAGRIIVSAEAEEIAGEKGLMIRVTDNGIGMSEEMIEKVLREDTDSHNKTEFFRHVGISNVNKRIQYDFGSEYGITITSRQGEFTTMTIRLPYVLFTEKQLAER